MNDIRFEIGQADQGNQYTPIQFGPRLPAIIEGLRRYSARSDVGAEDARLASALADALAAQP
jgi:hypothetical protein